jgi:hypothetical protein
MPNEENTKITKSSISNATSYEEIGEFWDEHDTADYWEQTYPVECTINLDSKSQVRYYGIDRNLSNQISAIPPNPRQKIFIPLTPPRFGGRGG